jgi:hypothetical protein
LLATSDEITCCDELGPPGTFHDHLSHLFLALLESDQRIDFHYQKPVSELVAPSPLLAETFSTNRWIQSRLLVVKELCRRGITDPEVP